MANKVYNKYDDKYWEDVIIPEYMKPGMNFIKTKEGKLAWDRFQMRIHKRILDLHCTVEVVKQLTTIPIEPGVDVELTLDGN